MAYLSSGSCPEGLTICMSGGDGAEIEFMWSDKKTGDGRFASASWQDFSGLLDKYIEAVYDADDPITCGQLMLSEVMIPGVGPRVRLELGKGTERFDFYEVTWDYVVSGYEHRKRADRLLNRMRLWLLMNTVWRFQTWLAKRRTHRGEG
jgi:hypothetical protein